MEHTKPLSNLLAVLENIFALESDLADLAELRNCRRLGRGANVLCAIAFGLVAHSLTAFLLGVLALGAFWLCIRLVKPFLAILAGLVIAAYWGGFGFYLAKWLLTFPILSSLPSAEVIGIAFLVGSSIFQIYL